MNSIWLFSVSLGTPPVLWEYGPSLVPITVPGTLDNEHLFVLNISVNLVRSHYPMSVKHLGWPLKLNPQVKNSKVILYEVPNCLGTVYQIIRIIKKSFFLQFIFQFIIYMSTWAGAAKLCSLVEIVAIMSHNYFFIS